ncbi:MAG: hypothetical protein WA063_04365 [Minisyncoccia bacterium]
MFKDLNKILDDVKPLQIQGASSVAKMIVEILDRNKEDLIKQSKDKDDFIDKIKEIASRLALAEPTETMAQNILGFIIFELQDNKIADLKSCESLLDKIIKTTEKDIHENEAKFIKNGLELIKSLSKKSRPINILTHCHSSGVRNVLTAVNKNGISFKVFNTETRPVFLGRATAEKMVKENIDVTMIIDSAAPFVVSGKSGTEFKTDIVLLGCDAITINGAAINKIGSYGISLSAYYEKIPVYIVTSLLKTKRGIYNILDIPMERRPCNEVWDEAPEGLNIVNFAFDVIPSEFITGFITEFGIIEPKNIKDTIAKNYPTLL